MDEEQANFLGMAAPGARRGEQTIPDGAKIERCKSCNAQIIWKRTEAGHALPLSLATCQFRDGVCYMLAHFTDCPQAKEWSAKRRRKDEP